MNWYEKSKSCGRYRTIRNADKVVVFSFRDNPAPAEKQFWDIVRNNQINGLKFRRQHKSGQFIVDFYCHKAGLVVEIDGGIHDGRNIEDAVRTRFLETFGIRVIRFTNDEVLNSPRIVKEKIVSNVSSVNIVPPSGARGV